MAVGEVAQAGGGTAGITGQLAQLRGALELLCRRRWLAEPFVAHAEGLQGVGATAHVLQASEQLQRGAEEDVDRLARVVAAQRVAPAREQGVGVLRVRGEQQVEFASRRVVITGFVERFDAQQAQRGIVGLHGELRGEARCRLRGLAADQLGKRPRAFGVATALGAECRHGVGREALQLGRGAVAPGQLQPLEPASGEAWLARQGLGERVRLRRRGIGQRRAPGLQQGEIARPRRGRFAAQRHADSGERATQRERQGVGGDARHPGAGHGFGAARLVALQFEVDASVAQHDAPTHQPPVRQQCVEARRLPRHVVDVDAQQSKAARHARRVGDLEPAVAQFRRGQVGQGRRQRARFALGHQRQDQPLAALAHHAGGDQPRREHFGEVRLQPEGAGQQRRDGCPREHAPRLRRLPADLLAIDRGDHRGGVGEAPRGAQRQQSRDEPIEPARHVGAQAAHRGCGAHDALRQHLGRRAVFEG